MKSPENKHGNNPEEPYEQKKILISEILDQYHLKRKLSKTLKRISKLALRNNNLLQ